MPPERKNTGHEFPLWLALSLAGLLGFFLYGLWNPVYAPIFTIVARGLGTTIFVTLTAFTFACLFGLLVALGGTSKFYLLRQITRTYVEVIRGIPVLVLLFYMAFVAAPALVYAWNAITTPLGFTSVEVRDFSLMWRAIAALTISYSAYISEIFRAGIQSVDKGQAEAARALGLGPWQIFRHVILYQAFRTVLPPLGNDFIAMIKDSALVSALGVADITQMGKIYSSGSFRFFETYNAVAAAYLLMTLGLSLALRALERRLWRSAK